MDAKQEYSAPQLVEYGRVEDLTHGWDGSRTDWFTGRNNDWPGPVHTGSN
jgi:hypothetical protein